MTSLTTRFSALSRPSARSVEPARDCSTAILAALPDGDDAAEGEDDGNDGEVGVGVGLGAPKAVTADPLAMTTARRTPDATLSLRQRKGASPLVGAYACRSPA